MGSFYKIDVLVSMHHMIRDWVMLMLWYDSLLWLVGSICVLQSSFFFILTHPFTRQKEAALASCTVELQYGWMKEKRGEGERERHREYGLESWGWVRGRLTYAHRPTKITILNPDQSIEAERTIRWSFPTLLLFI